MKFIFNQRVRVTGDFYVGQYGYCRAFHMVKGKKSDDPNLVDEPDFEGYAIELELFPNVQIMMRGDMLEDAPPYATLKNETTGEIATIKND